MSGFLSDDAMVQRSKDSLALLLQLLLCDTTNPHKGLTVVRHCTRRVKETRVAQLHLSLERKHG
jgi:hypothetical protein